MAKNKLTIARYQHMAKSIAWDANVIDYEVKHLRLSEPEREKHRIVADDDGRAVYSHDDSLVQSQVAKPRAKHSMLINGFTFNEMMYAMDVCGNLYVGERGPNFYHSFLLADGEGGVAAGRMVVNKGIIMYLDESSGHYKLKEHVWAVIYELVNQDFVCPEDPEVVVSPFAAYPDSERLDARIQAQSLNVPRKKAIINSKTSAINKSSKK